MTIKEYLDEMGFKQLQVAKDLGIDIGQLNKFLNGWIDLSAKRKKKLAEYLKISEEELGENWVAESLQPMEANHA